MILITGGTGFIGQALIRHLVEAGHPVRLLIRPSKSSPKIPKGVSFEVAVSGLSDPRSLRAAFVGVDAVYHLAGSEWLGSRSNLLATDIMGTQAIARAAAEAGVQRLFYVSHLGADRASAYPVFKAKAIAEEHIRRSGVGYTILRSALVYGPNDSLTTGLAQLLHSLPFFFLLPGEGSNLMQPLWVEDLAAVLTWSLEDETTRNSTFEVGGPEYLTFRQVVQTVMDATGAKRKILPVGMPYLRALTVLMEHTFRGLPISVYWLDYLAANRTCALDGLPHNFNLMPARLSQRLGYLNGKKWRISLLHALRGASVT